MGRGNWRQEDTLAKLAESAEASPNQRNRSPNHVLQPDADHGTDRAQVAFESRDMEQLHQALAAMPIEEAKKHMKACEDSGG